MAWLQKRIKTTSPAEAPDRRGDEPQDVPKAVVRWAADHFVDANSETMRQLLDAITQLKSECWELKITLSADRSKTGQAMYAFSWIDELHAFELSAVQARHLGIESGATIEGTGGKARRDARQSPLAVRIERLQINDGAPVSADIPITVAVTCEPGARPPRDARLRIAYAVSGLYMVLSPELGDTPQRVLSAQLEPLTEDKWVEGPVAMFVDLVVAQGDGDDLHFTAVSNTLSTLVDVNPARPVDESRIQRSEPRAAHGVDARAAVREAVMQWVISNLVGATVKTESNLAEWFNRVQPTYSVVKLMMSADLSKSGSATYGISWLDEFHTFELSEQQARALGIGPDTLGLQGLGPQRLDPRQSPLAARINALQINEGAPLTADAPFTLAVTCEPGDRLPAGAQLRVAYALDGINMVVSPPVEVSANNVVQTTIGPLAQGGWFEGPVPVFAELAFMHGDPKNGQFTVISNTLTELVDVARTSRTVRPNELQQAAADWCSSVVSGGRRGAQGIIEAIHRIMQGGNHFAMLLGGGVTANDSAYFVMSCAGGVFGHAMTAEQAVAAGLQSDSVRLTATAELDDGGRPHIARLGGLTVTGSVLSRHGVMGMAFVTCPGPVPTDLFLRMTYTFVASTKIRVNPVAVQNNSALILEIYNPLDKPQDGPVLLTIDLCVPESREPSAALTPVSNTVAVLLDVIGAGSTAVPTATQESQTAPALRPSTSSTSGATQRKPPSAADLLDLYDDHAVREAIAKYLDFAKDVLPEATPYDPQKGRQMRQCIDSIAVIAAKHQTAYAGLDQFAELLAGRGYTSEAEAGHMIARESGLPEASSRASYRLGDMARKSGDTNTARRFFDEAVASGYQTWVPHAATALAEMDMATGNYQQVEQNLLLVINSGNRYLAPTAAFNLGVVRNDHLGDPQGAEQAYQIGIDSGDPEWRAACAKGLGDLRSSRGDDSGSERAYEIAISANHPKWSPRAAFNLGVMRLRHDDYAGGIAANEIALASGDPDVAPLAARHLGIAYEKVGDIAGAERAYTSGMKSGNAKISAGCACDLGTLYAERHDYERAREAFRFAVACGDPDESPKAAFNLAVAENLQGNTAEAARACQIAIDSQHPEFAARAREFLKNWVHPN
jgi:tetratricopeptide (TPR) repeat protein